MIIFDKRVEVLTDLVCTESFAKTAKNLGISNASVSRQLRSLENDLGFLLFNRTTRQVNLTESGKELVKVLNNTGEELSKTLETLTLGKEIPSGRLKVNAPMAFGEKYLSSFLAVFAINYPQITLDIQFDDRRVDLIGEGYDLVIRIGTLKSSGLIARKLSNFPSCFCASPSFLKKYGEPKSSDDLRNLPAIIYSNAEQPLSINLTKGKKSQSIELYPSLFTNSANMLVQSVVQGLGFARIPLAFCKDLVDQGKLVHILSDYEITPDRGVYAIYADKRFLSKKGKIFIEELVHYFRNLNFQ